MQITQIIDIINQNPLNPLDPDKIASKLGLNSSHIQDFLYEWAGVTFQQFLELLTEDYFKQRLIKPSKTIENSFSNQNILKNQPTKLKAITCSQTKHPPDISKIYYSTIPSPFGYAFIAILEDKICHLSFIYIKNPDKNINSLRKKWPKADLTESTDQIKQFSRTLFIDPANTKFSLVVKGTDFQYKVWNFLLLIPRGKLYSYGQVASAIGCPTASRAVANAIGANPIAYLIPCHRVIRSSGALGGYHWGVVCKQAILAWEFAKDFEFKNHTTD